jgi:alpha-beta hydrolase superfamily lysophospholipase
MRKLFNSAVMALAIFSALSATVSISTTGASAEPVCYVDSKVGEELNLPVYEWVDTSVPQRGIIVAIHGLTFYADAYDKLARHLASEGFKFYACDLRGFGRWKTDYAKFGGDDQVHFTQSKDDLTRLAKKLRAENPDSRMIVLGESLGANYALWSMSEEGGQLFDGAVVFAPGVKTRIHPQPRMVVDFFHGLRHPKKPMNLEPYITPYLSNDRQVTQTCLKDPLICKELSPIELIKVALTNKESIQKVKNIPSDRPIMIVAGDEDAVFKTSAINKWAKRIGSDNVSIHELPNKGHLMLESQDVDMGVVGIVDDWLATAPKVTAEDNALVAGATEAESAKPVASSWLKTSIEHYSPIRMSKNTIDYAKNWSKRITASSSSGAPSAPNSPQSPTSGTEPSASTD